jgi:hypothetical protein
MQMDCSDDSFDRNWRSDAYLHDSANAFSPDIDRYIATRGRNQWKTGMDITEAIEEKGSS